MPQRLLELTTVDHVLRHKGRDVVIIDTHATVRDAVRLMESHRVGSVVVVCADRTPVGVLSDRDVALRIVIEGRDPARTRTVELMSPIVAASKHTSLLDALRKMTRHQVRHLPVMHGRALQGLVSLGDITAALEEDRQLRTDASRPYLGEPSLAS